VPGIGVGLSLSGSGSGDRGWGWGEEERSGRGMEGGREVCGVWRRTLGQVREGWSGRGWERPLTCPGEGLEVREEGSSVRLTS
jgi:hypothetical protein